VPDIVEGIDDLQASLGQRSWILHGNQHAVQNSAGGQSPAAKVIALTASGQNNENKTG
jgi:hypothetical protein